MPKQGDPKLFTVVPPILTFPNGSTATMIDSLDCEPTTEGFPQKKLIIDPNIDFKHMYRTHDKDFKWGGYIEWKCPEKDIFSLSNSPANPRFLILRDYRTGDRKWIDPHMAKMTVDLETAEVINHELRIETTKKDQEIRRLTEEGIPWEDMVERIVQEVTERLTQTLFRTNKPFPGEPPMQY